MNISLLFEKADGFLKQAMSEEGFRFKSMVKVMIPPSIKTSVSFFDGGFKISFPDEKPTVKITMVPVLSVLAIHLNTEGGVVEIDNFPDFSFSYEEIQKMILDLVH